MSIIDVKLALMTAQTVTTTSVSENTLDLQADGDAIGAGELYLCVQVGTEFDSSGDASTLTIDLNTGAANTCGTSLFKTAAIAQSALTAGARIVCAKLPIGVLRFLRISYTCSAAFTAGTLTVFLTRDPDIASKGNATGTL